MTAWGKSVGVEDKIKLLADPKGEFTKALEMGFDASGERTYLSCVFPKDVDAYINLMDNPKDLLSH